VFGTKKKGVAGGWTHLHVAEILDKNSYPDIIQVVFKEAELRGVFGTYGCGGFR
jgi:hypothetical protein